MRRMLKYLFKGLDQGPFQMIPNKGDRCQDVYRIVLMAVNKPGGAY